MKKLIVIVVLLGTVVPAKAGGIAGLTLPTWQNVIPAPIFGRCYYNGQWCGGLSSDIAYYQIPGSIMGKPLPQLYAAFAHYGNSQEAVKQFASLGGVYALHIGTPIGTLGTKALAVVNYLAAAGLTLPPWASSIDKAVSVETGAGYRLFGHTADLKTNFEAFAGIRATYPFDLSVHWGP